jgi:hypothetical protein
MNLKEIREDFATDLCTPTPIKTQTQYQTQENKHSPTIKVYMNALLY